MTPAEKDALQPPARTAAAPSQAERDAIIKLNRDEMRDRLRDAQEEYMAKRTELTKLLDAAHDRFIWELISAEAWLLARGMPEAMTDKIDWPIPPLKNNLPPDSASQFDEISADYDTEAP